MIKSTHYIFHYKKLHYVRPIYKSLETRKEVFQERERGLSYRTPLEELKVPRPGQTQQPPEEALSQRV